MGSSMYYASPSLIYSLRQNESLVSLISKTWAKAMLRSTLRQPYLYTATQDYRAVRRPRVIRCVTNTSNHSSSLWFIFYSMQCCSFHSQRDWCEKQLPKDDQVPHSFRGKEGIPIWVCFFFSAFLFVFAENVMISKCDNTIISRKQVRGMIHNILVLVRHGSWTD